MCLGPAVSLKLDKSRLRLRSGHLIPSLSAVVCGEEQHYSQNTSMQPETGGEGPATGYLSGQALGSVGPLQTSAVAVDGMAPDQLAKGWR